MWNQLDIIQTPPIVTSDFVYIRFLGDRSISETDFGTIQRNRVQEMAKWADKLKEVQKCERHVKTALVAPNNHYTRDRPSTSNAFREMLGLTQVNWGVEKEIPRKVKLRKWKDHKKESDETNFIIAEFISK